MASIIQPISAWHFTQVGGGKGTNDGEWLPLSQFPTTVHVELLHLGRIPDPFVGLNELEVQWVGEAEWTFKASFNVDESLLSIPSIDIVFEGLDTYCTVTLNGTKIADANNQFITYRVPSKRHLRPGQNELLLTFPSTFLKGKQLEKQHGKLALWNGDSSRLHVRKAQYNYGWDWGPVLMTVGPWRPVFVHAYSVRIADLRALPVVADDYSVELDVKLELSDAVPGAKANVSFKGPDGKLVIGMDSLDVSSGKGVAQFKFAKGTLKLWYPVGYGKQSQYTVDVEILSGEGTVLDSKAEKVGIRKVKVVQDKLVDQEGRTFLFEVNDIRVFCGGSNWIPADSFLTKVTPEIHRAWLRLLVDGNQNMIRVWGGGIYEPNVFYDICDELGILVWQDFMFGCGQYPAYDSLIESVQIEAEQNVTRLRHHPSIVIFAGNNEDYQVAESLNLELDYNDETSDFRNTTFPARYIYERLLPAAVAKCSDIYYHRSSPYSGYGKPTTDKTFGDLHQWNVWHGSQEPWHNWDILAGRFVSEFGMQGYPNIRTVDYWVGDDKAERYPQSRTMNNHNKADGFERRLELYLMENFKHAFDIESYVYYTQIMQAETLSSAYRLWRRNWKGRGKEYTAGALVWQINDCWPVTSWAIVDYFLRPKPAYFSIARELRPYTVGMTRKEKKTFFNDLTIVDYTIETVIEIWGTNSTLEDKKATLHAKCFDLDTDWTHEWKEEITLSANQATELWKGELPGQPKRTKGSDVPKVIIISARILDENGEVLARYSNWPEPFKFIHFPTVEDVGLNIKVDGDSVELSTKKPIKGIVLDVDGDDVKWSDQAIDLVPGDQQVVHAVGLNGRAVKARYLGDGTA